MRALLIISLIIGVWALSSATPPLAQQSAQQTAQQTPQQQSPSPACADGKFRDFDFWVGAWDVFGTANGQHQGINRIERAENGCLIKEHWTGDQGSQGFSINYYDPVSDLWRQVWVSGGGYSIDYTGGLNDQGQMVLEGEIHYYSRALKQPFRGTWTANEDGSVRQFFEQYDAEKDAWTTWFDGTYVRKEN